MEETAHIFAKFGMEDGLRDKVKRTLGGWQFCVSTYTVRKGLVLSFKIVHFGYVFLINFYPYQQTTKFWPSLKQFCPP